MNEKTELVLSVFAMALLCLIIFCVATSYFDATPPAMIDLSKWAAENAYLIAFCFCFGVGAYTLLRLKKKGE
jgi:hypothetical protein